MRRILYGTDFIANRSRVLREISAAMTAGKDGLLMIVPENQSHEAERMLCEVCGNRVSRYAEVVSLPRLAARMFSVAGGGAAVALDRGGKLLAMLRTCRELRSELKVFAAAGGSVAYLSGLVDLCDELESSCVTPDDLRRAASRMTGRIAQKTLELAAVGDVYFGLSRGHESVLTRLSALLREQPELLAGRHIWIDGFTYMTRQEREIALCLAEYADDFTLVLTGEISDGRDRVFGAVREFAGDFRRLDAVWERVAPDTDRRAPALAFLSERLFGADSSPFAGDSSCVRLRRAGTIYDECLACADDVMALVRTGNVRFRDIHVAYAESAYRPALAAVFARFDIPAYLSGSEPIENRPVAAFVLTALEAAAGGLDYEDVVRHMKTGFCTLEQDACDRLENYAYTWSIRGSAWLREWTLHPDGYGQTDTDESQHTLAELNAARVRLIEPLEALRRGLHEAANVGGQIRALYRYFEAVDLCGALDRRAAQLEGSQAALELAQLYEIVCNALAQMDEILGEQVCTEAEFSSLMRLILTQYDVSTITPYLDAVSVGSTESLYRSGCRYLFVLGAAEGSLPAGVSQRGPLSDADREQLRRCGVPILSGTTHDLDFAIASVWHLLSTPDDGLMMSWCAGGERAPSYLFTRAQKLLQTAAAPCTPYPTILLTDERSAGALLARAPYDSALSAAATHSSVLSRSEVVREAERWHNLAAYRLPPLHSDAVERLYGEKLYLSASRVDQLNSCRLAYFLRYGMRAKERRQAAFDAPLFGTFVHAVLEQTARRVSEGGGFHTTTADRIQTIAGEEMERYAAVQLCALGETGERLRYLFARSCAEVADIVESIGQELRKSDFLPVRFELAFADDGEMPPVQIPGGTPAEISGYVDRVDVYETDGMLYVRVIDYKTGKKAFDYTDILSGIGLQMLIYLFTLCELGDTVFGQTPLPAGVLYVPAREPLVSMSEKPDPEEAAKRHAAERVRKGLLLDDDTVLGAMEHGDGQPEFLPFRVGKDGTRTGDLASAAQLAQLREFVMRRLRQTADEIRSGELSPNPYTRGTAQGACTYCPYAQACHLDVFDGAVRRLAATNPAQFWERVAQESNGIKSSR